LILYRAVLYAAVAPLRLISRTGPCPLPPKFLLEAFNASHGGASRFFLWSDRAFGVVSIWLYPGFTGYSEFPTCDHDPPLFCFFSFITRLFDLFPHPMFCFHFGQTMASLRRAFSPAHFGDGIVFGPTLQPFFRAGSLSFRSFYNIRLIFGGRTKNLRKPYPDGFLWPERPHRLFDLLL